MLDVERNPSYGIGNNQAPVTPAALDTGVVHMALACIVASQRMLARGLLSMCSQGGRSGGREVQRINHHGSPAYRIHNHCEIKPHRASEFKC